jgi:exodeoxyribonuclease VII small subunit
VSLVSERDTLWLSMPPSKPKPTFEELYRQLEEKVALLEQGGLSLDDSLAAYEEAVGLAQRCQQMLDGAELRITRLRETIAADAEAFEPEVDEYAPMEDDEEDA